MLPFGVRFRKNAHYVYRMFRAGSTLLLFVRILFGAGEASISVSNNLPVAGPPFGCGFGAIEKKLLMASVAGGEIVNSPFFWQYSTKMPRIARR